MRSSFTEEREQVKDWMDGRARVLCQDVDEHSQATVRPEVTQEAPENWQQNVIVGQTWGRDRGLKYIVMLTMSEIYM